MTATTATELARAFDDEFVRPLAPRAAASVDLLAIRIGDMPYALARSDLAGLFADKRITPLPGGPPALLGLAGFRGALVPAYDLRVVLGGAAAAAPARWLATAAATPVAVMFDQLDGLVRVTHGEIVAHAAAPGSYVRHAVHASGELRPVIDIAAVIAALVAAMTELRGAGAPARDGGP